MAKPSRVKVTKEETTIVDGEGKPEAIKGRIEMIKRQVEETDSDFDREKLQERLAKLSGGVAVIQVGAATETELKEKKHRIEDALSATRAAVQEGMIPGGGSSLIHAIKAIEKYVETAPKTNGHAATGADEKIGIDIIARRSKSRCVRSPTTPGFEGSVEVNRVKAEECPAGLRCDDGRDRRHVQSRYRRAVQSHALGAAKRGVDRCAVLTTETLIADKPEPKKEMAGGGGMPGGMGGYDMM